LLALEYTRQEEIETWLSWRGISSRIPIELILQSHRVLGHNARLVFVSVRPSNLTHYVGAFNSGRASNTLEWDFAIGSVNVKC